MSHTDNAIAIIGMSCRFPDADHPRELWQNLCAGHESVRLFTADELLAAGVPREQIRDPAYIPAGCVVRDIDAFDAAFFGFTPREAEILDPQQRLLLECAYHALEDAGYARVDQIGDVGVYVGVSSSSYAQQVLATRPDVIEAMGVMALTIANDKDFAASQIAYRLGLTGPAISVATACSTSLVAIHTACTALLNFECDVALAGGASIKAQQVEGYHYQQGGILSADGHCRPFAAEASGTISGSGAGIVTLKRLADAEADGDTIYAVIAGSAVNNDGADKLGFTAPSVRGQARAIREALAIARTDPAEIGYVEAHGTATPLGDPVEIAALTEAHGKNAALPACAIGSIKSNFGHLDAAAGVAGLIKTALAVASGTIPPSLHFATPNPQIGLERTRFFVANQTQHWPLSGARCAGVSSFGIGGTNAHIVLREWEPGQTAASTSRPAQLIVASAKDAATLTPLQEALDQALTASDRPILADASFTLIAGRPAYRFRAARAYDSQSNLATGDWIQREARSDLKVAWLFPGQGSQHVQMARDLYLEEPVFRDTVQTLSAWVRQHAGWDPIALLYPDEDADQQQAEAALNNTRYTQIALFIVEYAMAQLWRSLRGEPDLMVGHSLSEYVAACVAGVLEVEDALHLLDARSRMIASLPNGTMASVQIDAPSLLSQMLTGVDLCAENGPEHCVIGGPTEAVAAMLARLAGSGIEGRVLDVSHAFHSAMLDPILDEFRALVARTPRQAPKRQYLSSTTGRLVTEAEVLDPDYWVRHLRETVAFRSAMETIRGLPDSWMILDLGPSGTAASLARVNGVTMNRVVRCLPRDGHSGSARATWLNAVGNVWAAGKDLNLEALHAGETRRKVRLPGYAFARTRHWLEPGDAQQLPPPRMNAAALPLFTCNWNRDSKPAATVKPVSHRLVFGESFEAVAEWLDHRDRARITLVQAGDTFAGLNGAFTIRPQVAEDYQRLFAALAVDAPPVDQIVFAWPLQHTAAFVPGSNLLAMQCALAHLVAARKRAAALAPTDFVMLVRRAFQVSGDDVINPSQRALAAMVTVLAQEEPDWSCRVIDLGNQVDPRALHAALGGPTDSPIVPLVALRGRFRFVPTFAHAEVAAATAETDWHGKVVVITGGAGQIGLALAGIWANRGARVVLTGRRALTQLPTAVQDRLTALQRLNDRVTYHGVNLSDVDALAALLLDVKHRYGHVDLLIHAAANMDHTGLGLLASADAESFERHHLAKIAGTAALVSATAAANVGSVVLMSSLAACLGGIGMSAYAAANAFMEALVEGPMSASRPAQWYAIGWDGLSADPAVAAPFSSKDVASLIEQVLGTEAPGVYQASREDMDSRWRQWVDRGLGKTRTPTPPNVDRSGYVAPATDTERVIAAAFEELIGTKPVGAKDDFFALGGDSLLATQLCSRLRKLCQVDLPISAIFEHAVVERLAAYLISLQATSVIGDAEVLDLVRELADLDESALEDLLNAQEKS
ncbi:hypothetical protein C7S18_07985 [Ahniella affigens]|uniref:Uncharacterized protein n=1 Tax=Ahniella affigens TaxID=2021234 RepID=A0A2P1PQM5_9GAMM|nr:type I polyketide synthase [Ahniella affigens]AVP97135.1 hypothetical protein C7S18_07985 [Ahniella affigens]